MKKRLRGLFYIVAACAFAGRVLSDAPTASKPKSASVPSVQYKISLQSKRYGNKGTAVFTMKGDKMCWERKTGGGLWLLLVKNDDGLFLVDKLNKKIGKYPPNSSRNSARRMVPGPTGAPLEFLKGLQAKKTGEAQEGSKKCEIWSYVEPETMWHCKLYLDRKSKSPVKLIMSGETDKTDTITVTYASFKTRVEVADSTFQLPKDYPIRDMPTPSATKRRKPDAQAKVDADKDRKADIGPDKGYASKREGDAQSKPPPSDQEQKGQTDGPKG